MSKPFLPLPEDNVLELTQALENNDWETLKGISTAFFLFKYGTQLRFEQNPDGSVSAYEVGKS
jgi:hypothetical protein